MTKITFLRPFDQPQGTKRFLHELRNCFTSGFYCEARIAVAFATSGPLLRLVDSIGDWRKQHGSIEAILGIDLVGTSRQALEFAMEHFNKTYITHTTSSIIFHPKFYLFFGDHHAVCYYGSHNLTVGGTETNLEGGIKVEFSRPEDEMCFQEALSCWTSLLPASCTMTRQLDQPLLEHLIRKGLVFDETASKYKAVSGAETAAAKKPDNSETSPFTKFFVKPPSPLPKSVFVSSKVSAKKRGTVVLPGIAASEALIIQIVPHHNGEVFLSKLAVDQNPTFFGYPFTGRTIPKKASNPSYPQRVPDPLVQITAYDSKGSITLFKAQFSLNTVFYEKKSEIRITFPSDLVKLLDPFSIMVMQKAEGGLDYVIQVFNPGTQQYAEYLSTCNQTLPTGGAQRPRKMGWI